MCLGDDQIQIRERETGYEPHGLEGALAAAGGVGLGIATEVLGIEAADRGILPGGLVASGEVREASRIAVDLKLSEGSPENLDERTMNSGMFRGPEPVGAGGAGLAGPAAARPVQATRTTRASQRMVAGASRKNERAVIRRRLIGLVDYGPESGLVRRRNFRAQNQ